MPKDVCKIELPEAGTAETITLKPGQVNTLSFPSDAMVSSPRLMADGSVEIALVNGSKVIIQNFQELAFSADSCGRDTIIQLSDNSIIYPEEMYAQLTGEEALEVVEVEPAAGEEPTETALEQVEETIQEPQIQQVAEEIEEVINIEPAAGDPTAQQVASIEPQAGVEGIPGAGRGYGFQSRVDDAPLNPIPAIGPIPETALQFDIPEPDDFLLVPTSTPTPTPSTPTPPDFQIPSVVVKEDNMVQVVIDVTNNGGPTATNKIEIEIPNNWTVVDLNGGVIDPVTGYWTITTAPGADFTGGPKLMTELDTDVDQNNLFVRVTETGPDGTEISTGTYNILTDAVADIPTIDADAACVEEGSSIPLVIDVATTDTDGSERIQMIRIEGVPTGVSLNHGTEVSPGVWELSEADLVGLEAIAADGTAAGTYNLTVTVFSTEDPVTDNELDFSDNTAQNVDTLELEVKADDNPIIVNDKAEVDESGALIVADTISVDFGADTPGTIEAGDASTFSVNGSVAGGSLTSKGDAVTVTVSGNTFTGTAGGRDVFTLVINNDGSYVFSLIDQLDHADVANPDDVINLVFGIVATDSEGDEETGTITICVNDDGPQAVNDSATLNDVDLTATGNVLNNDDSGFDEPATVTNVRFNGVDTAVPTTGTATIVGNFGTLIIAADGSYTYTRTTDAGGTDVFTYTMVDNDGDPDTANLNVTLQPGDDTPIITTGMDQVDESNLLKSTVGVIPVDYGTDAPGTLDPRPASTFTADGSLAGGTLTSKGEAVTVTLSGNTYTGAAGGRDIFTMTINENGSYTFNLLDQLDHGNPSDPNDVINLNFGIIATDADGDTATAVFTIKVFDDGPVANDDAVTLSDVDLTATGNVLNNDDVGYDEAPTVTNVRFNGVDTAVPTTGTATIIGNFGTLVIAADGSYTYTRASDAAGTDTFTYTMVDNDGDPDTANLNVTLQPGDVTPIVSTETNDVDESGPLMTTGTIDVDFGNDGPGTITPKGANTFTATGSVAGGSLTSCGEAVTVALSGNTYTGTAGGRDVFTLVINTDGTYKFTLLDQLDHADGTNNNDIINLNFGYVATDADGDMAMSTITIRVADDGPVANDDTDSLGDSDTVATGNVTINDDEGYDEPGMVTNVRFNGVDTAVPTTGTATIVGNFGTLVIAADGSYTYTRSTDSAGQDVFTYTLTDKDGDSDNANLTVTLAEGDDTPVIVNAMNQVDETNYNGSDLTVSGLINVNYFGDGPGTITPKDANTFTATGSVAGGNLTSHGEAVTVTLNGNTYTGMAGGREVFTMTINTNGTYSFTAKDVLDHGDTTNHNDVINLNFGVTATDADGDMAMGTVTIKVFDDGPVVYDRFTPIDETNLDGAASISVNGQINFDFGEDGAGEVVPEGTFMAMNTVGGPNVPISSGGSPVTVSATANGYEGRDAGNNLIFKLVINPLTGQYTYTQYEEIDHPNANDPDDVIWLKFAVNVIDDDGDIDTAFIGIDVHDDGPVAVDDTDSLGDTDTSTSGNVLVNDDIGVDNESPAVIKVTYNNVDTAVPTTGTATIVGNFGTLTIAADGSYTYTRTSTSTGQDVFCYMMRDGDGDMDMAKLTINVTEGDVQPIVSTEINQVDESNVLTTSGTIDVDFGTDGPGTITPKGANTFTATGNTGGSLTSCGEAVTVTLSGNTYTGTAGGRDVFTLQINTNGTYTFNLLDQLDHSNPNNPNEIINLNFGYTATDADGDMAMSTITIQVRDDAPVAVNDTNSLNDTQTTATGNVTINDDEGYDEPGMVTNVRFNGVDTSVPTNATAVIVGNFGTLEIARNGSYIYTRTSDSAGQDVFTYTLTDKDGDSDTATLTVTLAEGDDTPIVTTETNTVDESGPLMVTGTIDVDFGTDGPGTVTPKGANTFTATGATGGSLTSCGEAVTVTLSGNTYTGTAGGRDIFTLVINANGTYKFTLLDQLDHSNPNNANEIINLNFGYVATDADGDMSMSTITIQVRDDAPIANDDSDSLGDTDTVATGNVTINDDEGYDEPGMVTNVRFNGADTAVPTTGTATIVGNFGTLVIAADGSYTYTRSSDSSGQDVFTYTLTDKDGDSDNANLTVTLADVQDDTPIITNSTKMIDETDYNGNNLTVNGSVTANFFGDGPGTITPKGASSFTATGATGGTLTSLGVAVVVTLVGNKYIGTAGGREVFELTINNNGTYSFTAKDTLDHSNPNNPNEIINLNFGVTATDNDGDMAMGTITIQVKDDAPIALDESIQKVGEELRAEGNVLANDVLSEDTPNTVTSVQFGGQSYAVSATGVTTIDGQYGTLYMQSNGDYTYLLDNDLVSLEFNPTKSDFDSMPMSLTSDNITVRVLEPAYTGMEQGKLIWYDKGFGVWGNGDANTADRVNGGEVLEFTFNNQPVTGVNFSLEHFQTYGTGQAYLDILITTTGGGTLYLEYALPTGTGWLDDAGILLDAADYGGGYITKIEIASLYHVGHETWFDFTVKDVEAFLDLSNVMDEFDYTVTDGDGDSDSASLAFMGENGHITIAGQDCEEIINGTNGDDVIHGYSGDDTIYGNGGNDTIYGGLDEDTIHGGAGDDIIYGGGGTDKIYGGSGNDIINAGATLYEEPWNNDGGPNEIWGGSGADTFLFERNDPGFDIIHDFSTTEGDIIDLSDFLQGYDSATEAIENFVFQRQEGNNTIISVDVTGSGNAAGAEDVVVLENVTGKTLDELIAQAQGNV